MRNYTYEYDVVVLGTDGASRNLEINPCDLATAREIARSWDGRIVERKVTEWEPLSPEKFERDEFVVQIGDMDDYGMSRIVVTRGPVTGGEEFEVWDIYFASASASIREHGYTCRESLGNDHYRVFR